MTEMKVFKGIDIAILKQFGIAKQPGYIGAFTRRQALDAMPNGTTVIKRHTEKGDRHLIGTEGKVLGSILFRNFSPHPLYFVEWSDEPNVATACIGWKIAAKES